VVGFWVGGELNGGMKMPKRSLLTGLGMVALLGRR
jgi:hypothetical protein